MNLLAKLAAYAVKIDCMPEQNIKLNTCIDKIDPKLLGGLNSYERLRPWCCLKNRFQSINKDQSCSGMNDAHEPAGGLRGMEFARLELKKEQKRKKEFKALNCQFADLQGENKRLAQKVGNGKGGREGFK